jgi:hypothetical protein
MMRRALAIATVLLVSGLLPLAAATGFCAQQPCCHAHHHAGTASLGTHPDCCNETNCDTTTHHVDATSAKSIPAQPQLAIVPLAPQAIAATLASHGASGGPDTGPPPTRQRLATLSILLI